MSSKKSFSGYVSEVDCFLQAFDKKHPGLSASQQKEIAKAKRVSRLRDDKTATDPSPIFPDE